MRIIIFNTVLGTVIIFAGAVFFASYGWGLAQIANVFGIPALAAVTVCHLIVWLGIAALFDKRHPPERP